MVSKRLLGIMAATALALTAVSAAAGVDFPSKPVRVIVPYPAGGIVDIVARAVTQQIASDWKSTVFVEAKPGADSNIGTAEVARSKPDGYTWLVTGPAALVNPIIYKDAGWDALRDLKCVGVAVWNQSVAVVPAALPVKTMQEFVSYAKAHPGLMYGDPGVGSSIDLTARRLTHAAGIDLTFVGYKGQPPALVDLIGNRIQIEIVSLILALPQIKDGSLRPLAVFTPHRVKELPDVPTIAEAGYPGAAYVPWYGIYVPAATPEKVVERIHASINKALTSPEVEARLSKSDIPGSPMTLQALAALMKSDTEKMSDVVKESGLKPR
jgi:tripartite-type tricarboxylate transporter receptor subunit TctC